MRCAGFPWPTLIAPAPTSLLPEEPRNPPPADRRTRAIELRSTYDRTLGRSSAALLLAQHTVLMTFIYFAFTSHTTIFLSIPEIELVHVLCGVWFAILRLNLQNIISSAAVQIVSNVCNPIFRKYSSRVQIGSLVIDLACDNH